MDLGKYKFYISKNDNLFKDTAEFVCCHPKFSDPVNFLTPWSTAVNIPAVNNQKVNLIKDKLIQRT